MSMRALLFTLVTLAASASALAAPRIIGTEHRATSVSAKDGAPLSLYVWEKRAANIAPRDYARTGKVVLLVHGATISGRPDFDLALPPDRNGVPYSLMDRLVREGYDVFAVDIQNYGGSDRHSCGLCVTSQVAANDIDAAVDYIRQLRNVAKVNLLGWSWGATTTALFTEQHPDKVRRLVQYAPNVRLSVPGLVAPTAEFRPVDPESCCRGDFVAEFTDAGVFEAYVAAIARWHKEAPNGLRVDHATRMPLLDPKKITVPTMLIFGARDAVCTIDQPELPGYFRDLATTDKQFIVVPDGGHALLLMQMREKFFAEVVKWFALG